MRFRYCDEAQASLCKCAHLPEPSLPAHEILILITLYSDYTCTNVQTHQALASRRINTGSPEPRHSTEISCAGSNGDKWYFVLAAKALASLRGE